MGSPAMIRYGGVALAVVLALTLLGRSLLPSLTIVGAWLISINLVTFLIYGFDKLIAGRGIMRVPEVLIALALLGGTPAAVLGMNRFRHKTSKQSFRTKFLLMVIAQIVVLIVLYWGLSPDRLGQQAMCTHPYVRFGVVPEVNPLGPREFFRTKKISLLSKLRPAVCNRLPSCSRSIMNRFDLQGPKEPFSRTDIIRLLKC